MQTLKSKDYKPGDIKVQLKKRRKNLGLLQNNSDVPTSPMPLTSNPVVNPAWIFLVGSGPGANFVNIQTLRKSGGFGYGTFYQPTLNGASNHNIKNGVSLYDNQCFFSDLNGNLVFNYNQQVGLIDYIGDSTGTAGSSTTQWHTPAGMAISGAGQLYVCDTGNSRTKIYDFGKFAFKKTLNIDYTAPTSISTDTNGNIYCLTQHISIGVPNIWVLDNYGNSHVPNFDLPDAVSICVDKINLKIYYTKGNNANDIFSCGLDGSGIQKIVTSGNRYFSIATDGNVICAACNDDTVKVYTINGTLLNSISIQPYTYTITYLSISQGFLYVLNSSYAILQKVSLADYSSTQIFSLGYSNNDIKGISVDPKGYIYLSRASTNMIEKFNNTGIFCSSWSGPGSTDGLLNSPYGVSFNEYTCQIAVADNANNRIQSFSYGAFVTSYASSVAGVAVTNIVFDFTGIYSINLAGNVIVKYDVAGTNVLQQALENVTTADAYCMIYNNINDTLYIKSDTSSLATTHTLGTTLSTFGKFAGYFFAQQLDSSFGLGLNDNLLYIVITAATDPWSRRLYVFDISNNYDETWQDITKYVLNDKFDLDYTSADSNFSLGKLTIGDITFTVNNENDKFDFENNPDSLFYDSTGLYQRNQSLVRILVSDNEVSRGLLDGKSIVNDENTLSFTANSPFLLFDTVLSTKIIPALSNGMTLSQILNIVIFNSYFQSIVDYNSADISILYNAVINDITQLGSTTLEMLSIISQLGMFSFGLYNGSKFFAFDFVTKSKTRVIDYLITENNFLGIERGSYNNGEQRLFKSVSLTTGALDGAGKNIIVPFTIPVSVQLSFNENRDVAIDAKSITNTTVAAAIASNFQYVTSWPSKEMQVRVPFINYNINMFTKNYGFNIFGETRGLKFNSPSLDALTSALPSKETATDGSGRLIYYPLSIKHVIGNENYSIITLKEFIDDHA